CQSETAQAAVRHLQDKCSGRSLDLLHSGKARETSFPRPQNANHSQQSQNLALGSAEIDHINFESRFSTMTVVWHQLDYAAAHSRCRRRMTIRKCDFFNVCVTRKMREFVQILHQILCHNFPSIVINSRKAVNASPPH
ncbi:MAG: hypothetical protein MUQ12_04010, partial [Loktanella sp.]|nr:hypothetical protein [Loktanella sp.]